MCDLCMHSPCVSNCPNSPEPPVVYTCDNCGGNICDGDRYIMLDNIADVKTLIICEECISDCKHYAEYDAEAHEPDPCDLAKERWYREHDN